MSDVDHKINSFLDNNYKNQEIVDLITKVK
ncbi:uncharacterized protein METZ01_LOCUS485736 [marine metagenome]|uniref:Uncharacterized protein n=1 Tax=marine metagenome TaxID=408172 RepID=A0A383CL13_9ZZZZ